MREKITAERCQSHILEDEKGVLTTVTEQEKLKPTGRAGAEEGTGKMDELLHATISRKAQEVQKPGTSGSRCISLVELKTGSRVRSPQKEVGQHILSLSPNHQTTSIALIKQKMVYCLKAGGPGSSGAWSSQASCEQK